MRRPGSRFDPLGLPRRSVHASRARVRDRVTAWLRHAPPFAFAAYAIAAAFSTYFCMYAFRKPVGAATFEGESIGDVQLKIALLISQILGYALSKFIGIKAVTELSAARRSAALLGLIAMAELALLVFAVVPPAGKVVAIFCNGLPLGAVWGLVYGFLEGRRMSEILGAGLSASYIVASGAVKSVGRWLMAFGVSESWMPAATGALFVVPFIIAVAALRAIPPPSREDQLARTRRQPMDGHARKAFAWKFAPGLVGLTGLYMVLTAYRDFRDNFAAELWIELGLGDEPAIFTLSELPVALAVLLSLALIYRIHDNRRALMAVHAMMLAGTVLVGVATFAFDAGLVGGVGWMVAVGIGLYLAYVPYGCVLFDRLIAATGTVGTAVFMIYVTDAFGYAGSIGILLWKNFGEAHLSWLEFFRGFSYAASLLCSLAFVVAGAYFARITRK